MTRRYWIGFVCVDRFYFKLLRKNKPGVTGSACLSIVPSSSALPTRQQRIRVIGNGVCHCVTITLAGRPVRLR